MAAAYSFLSIFKPETYPLFASSFVCPYLDRRVTGFFNNRPWPADSLATPHVGHPISLRVSFRYYVPEGRFLVLNHRMAFECQRNAIVCRPAVDKVPLEKCVKSIKVSVPIATVLLKQRQSW